MPKITFGGGWRWRSRKDGLERVGGDFNLATETLVEMLGELGELGKHVDALKLAPLGTSEINDNLIGNHNY